MSEPVYWLPEMVMPEDHDWETKAMAGMKRGRVMMTPGEVAGLALAYKQLLDTQAQSGELEGSFVGDHLRGD
jgi:hypothetical protein